MATAVGVLVLLLAYPMALAGVAVGTDVTLRPRTERIVVTTALASLTAAAVVGWIVLHLHAASVESAGQAAIVHDAQGA